MDGKRKPELWWWAGDEPSARRRFSERFNRPEALMPPQPKLFEVQHE